MKKKIALGVGIGVVAVAIAAVVFCVLGAGRFALESEYYGENGYETIDVQQLQDLIAEKKSFALLISKPACTASTDFEKIVTEFSEKYQIGFEKIDFVEVRDAKLIEGLKYNPSMALYHEGKLVTFLSADEDNDLEAYQSEAGFAKWWRKYVKVQK